VEDPFERHARPFRDRADAVGGPVELAEDDFVLAQEDRPEVADVELCRRRCDAAIESVEVGLADVGPEALGDEAGGSRFHSADGRDGGPLRKR